MIFHYQLKTYIVYVFLFINSESNKKFLNLKRTIAHVT